TLFPVLHVHPPALNGTSPTNFPKFVLVYFRPAVATAREPSVLTGTLYSCRVAARFTTTVVSELSSVRACPVGMLGMLRSLVVTRRVNSALASPALRNIKDSV